MSYNLPIDLLDIDSSGDLNLTGDVTANAFIGDGSQLTNLPSSIGSNPFDQDLNTTDSPTFVDGDFSGRVLTNKLENVDGYSYIRVSGLTTSPIRFWRDFQPQVDNSYSSGSDTLRWSNTYSVDGSFTGSLNSEVGGDIRHYSLGDTSATDNEYLKIYSGSIQSNQSFAIEPISEGSGVVRDFWIMGGYNRTRGYIKLDRFGAVQIAYGNTANLYASNNYTRVGTKFYPDADNTHDLGLATFRFANTYSVDGSFSGNLNVESGGSQRLYNLGTEGDADTEYLETSYASSRWNIQPKTTGSGGNRELRIWAPQFSHITLNSGGTFIYTYAGVQHMYCNTDGVTTTGLNVTGNVTFGADTIVNSGGSQRIYNLGSEGDADTEYLEISNNGTNFEIYTAATGSGVARNVTLGDSTTGIAINPVGQQLLVYGGGALKLDILGGGCRFRDDLFPITTNTIDLGTSSLRWSNVASVDGDFSGDLTIGSSVNAPIGTVFQYNNQNRFLLTAGGTLLYADLLPSTDGSWNVGESNRRFAGVHGVDGSFSGSLNSEVGGSYKLYNLGTEGDTDTEFVSMAWDNNDFKITANSTGSGTVQDIDIAGKQVALRHNSGSSISTRLSVDSNSVKVWRNLYGGTDGLYACGTTSNRWSNVYSVDGDFSGTVTAAGVDMNGDIDFKVNGYIRRSGVAHLRFGSRMSTYIDLAPSSDNTYALGVDGNRWSNVASVDGSFSGNLVSEAGGGLKLYNLGTVGDTDTEYVETSWGSNIASIYSKATGTGVVRELTVGNADNRFRFTSGGVICAVNSVTKLNIGSNFTYLGSSVAVLPDTDGTIELGRDAARWENVASVNGDFSGDVVMAANVDFTGLPTTDPGVAGRMWNDSGSPKISSGGGGGAPPP